MKIGYISRTCNKDVGTRYEYKEFSGMVLERKIGVRVYTNGHLAPFDYQDAVNNTKMMLECPNVVLVTEPVFITKQTNQIKEHMIAWCEKANAYEQAKKEGKTDV